MSLAAIAAGQFLYPSRTQKISLPAFPIVLKYASLRELRIAAGSLTYSYNTALFNTITETKSICDIPIIVSESGGHSGRVIPVPIPNTEDKSASVPYCTEVRESSGTTDRCWFAYLYL